MVLFLEMKVLLLSGGSTSIYKLVEEIVPPQSLKS